MPSLTTRRRRAGLGAEVAAGELLEGGGSRGQGVTDSVQATEAKMAGYRAQTAAASAANTRAHLVAFPLFLFGLLAVCSHPLHLSFTACVLVPALMGATLLGLSTLADQVLGKARSNAVFERHGGPLVGLLLFLTLTGLAVSQMFFRDKLGKPLL